MADKTKDLTGIMEYSKKLEESGQFPELPKDTEFVTEEAKPEKIESFESLEEYSKAHAGEIAEPSVAEPSVAEPSLDMNFGEAVTGIKSDMALGNDEMSVAPPAVPQQPDQLAGLTETGVEAPAEEPKAAEVPADSFANGASEITTPKSTQVVDDFVPFPTTKAEESANMGDRLKDYSERITAGKPMVQASVPFSLKISGPLAVSERERLLSILSRENFGISEMDLEPQFAAEKILIPRISEYAGVLIVQALRGARVRMALAPSDSVFASEDTRAAGDDLLLTSKDRNTSYCSEVSHPAEDLPVTQLAELPDGVRYELIDAVTATAALKTSVVEATSSVEYQEMVDALQRELKYKAFRKGATAIVNFSITLSTLTMPTHYRLTAMGSAVKRVVGTF